MAISKEEREKIKKNKSSVDLDFGFDADPLPPKKESEVISFKDIDAQLAKSTEAAPVKNSAPVKKTAPVKNSAPVKKTQPKENKSPIISDGKRKGATALKRNKYVLLELMSAVDARKDHPFITSSVPEIAKVLEVSKRTAQNYLRSWEENKMIVAVEEFDPSTKKPRKYQVDSEIFD